MNTKKQTIKKAFSAAISSFNLEENAVSCFHLDLDQPENHELCVQRQNSLLVINEKNTRELKFSLIVPDAELNHYYQCNEDNIQCIKNGQKQWSYKTTKNVFGMGICRDSWADVSWDSEKIGFYEKQDSVITMALVDTNNNGQNELVVVSTWAKLLILSSDGQLILKHQLPRGRVNKAAIFPIVLSDEKDEVKLAISLDYNRRIHYNLVSGRGGELTQVLSARTGKKLNQNDDIYLLRPIYRFSNVFFTTNDKSVDFNLDKGFVDIECNDDNDIPLFLLGLNKYIEKKDIIIIDPENQYRFVSVQLDASNSKLSIGMANSDMMWQADLPPTDASEYSYCLALSPESEEPKNELIALWLKVEKIDAELDVCIYKKYLLVFSMDGKLVAQKEFQAKGEASRGYHISQPPVLLLQPLTPNGELHLIVIGSETLAAYSLNFEKELSSVLTNSSELNQKQTPEYPLPEHDLWQGMKLLWK